jgi:hypothetical protein
MHAYRYDGLEALWAGHVWYAWGALLLRLWVEHEHAEADERVAEEDCDGEENQDEEDVDFLAEAAVGEGDG